jgi:hypothetical protein
VFPAESHEGALDKNTLLVQDLERQINQCLRLPDGDAFSISRIIPSKELRANKALVFDGDGNPQAAVLTVSDVTFAEVTATGTTESRSLADRFAEVINVKDFGAEGDGSADDTDDIQAAINLAESRANGAVVYFPNGIYMIRGLSVTGAIDLRGNGERSILRQVAATQATNGGMIFINNSTDFSKISIKDLQIDGNIATMGAPQEDFDCIHIRRSIFDIELENLRITGAPRDGIGIERDRTIAGQDRQTLSVFNCDIDDCGRHGMSLYGLRESLISRCKVESTAYHCIAIAGRLGTVNGVAEEWQVANCDLELASSAPFSHSTSSTNDAANLAVLRADAGDSLARDYQICDNLMLHSRGPGILIESGFHAKISGNSIINSNDESIRVDYTIVQDFRIGLHITDNVFDDPNNSDNADVAAINIESSIAANFLYDLQVIGNLIRDVERFGTLQCRHGLRIDTTNLTVIDALVEGNQFKDCLNNSVEIIDVNIQELILGSGNKFKKGQLYGTVALTGTVAVNVDAVGMPDGLAMVAEATRVVLAGTAGHISPNYDTPNSRVQLVSSDAADTSTALWRVLGTADAFV